MLRPRTLRRSMADTLICINARIAHRRTAASRVGSIVMKRASRLRAPRSENDPKPEIEALPSYSWPQIRGRSRIACKSAFAMSKPCLRPAAKLSASALAIISVSSQESRLRGVNERTIRRARVRSISVTTGGLIGTSATPEPQDAIMLPWLGGFHVCVCAAEATLCPSLLHCSHPRNEQDFCHHREGARSRGAGHVTLPDDRIIE